MRRALASVAHFRPNLRNLPVLLVVAMALLGTAHVLVRTWTYGAAITPDAIHYLSAAESIAAGTGLKVFDGGLFVFYPPFFPMLLAFIDILGIEPRESVRWVNAAIFGLIILTSGFWLLRTLASRTLALAATALILVSLPLNSLASQAMTEPLFVLLAILALMQMGTFIGGEAKWRPVLLAAVFTALAALTRYPGVTLILAGVAVPFLHPSTPFVARMRYAIVFGGIASLPVAAALLRRWLIETTLEAPEGASGQSLSISLRQVARAAREWVVPESAPDWSANLWIAAAALLAAGAATMLFLVVIRRQAAAPNSQTALPFVVFSLIYLAFTIAVVPRLVGQPIDGRYLLPLYVPVILGCAFLVNEILDELRQRMLLKWVPASLVLVAILSSIGFSIQRNAITTVEAREFGYFNSSYNTTYWDEFETLKYLKENPLDGPIFSSGSSVLWWTHPQGTYFGINADMDFIIRSIENLENDSYIVSLFAAHSYHNPFISYLNDVAIIFDGVDGSVIRIPANWHFDERHFLDNLRQFTNTLGSGSTIPVASSVFDIYLVDNIIIYNKSPCDPQDTRDWFFLHITPKDTSDLPDHRERHGFDNLDFQGSRNDIFIDNQCIVSVPLPYYAIHSISTGQYVPGVGQLWITEFLYPTVHRGETPDLGRGVRVPRSGGVVHAAEVGVGRGHEGEAAADGAEVVPAAAEEALHARARGAFARAAGEPSAEGVHVALGDLAPAHGV